MTALEKSNAIRAMRSTGAPYSAIATLFHVSKATAMYVAKGKDLVERPPRDPSKRHRKYICMTQAVDIVSVDIIKQASKCPQGVSDARWRMELSRRRMAADCTTGSDAVDAATIPNPLHGLGGWHR